MTEELVAIMDAWDQAMVANDPGAIGSYMADDWGGDLAHDVMETLEPTIRAYEASSKLPGLPL